MPKVNTIVIPSWVHALKKKQKNEHSLLTYLPLYMHWRSVEYIEQNLHMWSIGMGVWEHLQTTLRLIKERLVKENHTHPLVACISLSKFLPNQLIVSFTHDVHAPETTACVVLKINDEGSIREVAREFTMSYATITQ